VCVRACVCVCVCVCVRERERERERETFEMENQKSTFGCQQVIKQPSLLIDQRRNSSLSFEGNLI
jgi:hypothetical protein